MNTVISSYAGRVMLFLVFFVFLFSPPVVSNINVLLILSALCSVSIALRYWGRFKEFVELLRQGGVIGFASVFMAAVAWLLLAMVMSLGEPVDYLSQARLIYRFFLIVPIALIVVVWIVDTMGRGRPKDMTRSVIWYIVAAFLLQAIIAVISLALPYIKETLVDIMATNTGSSVFNNQYELSRRFYGFANSMLDSFGYAIGLTTVMLATSAIYYRKYALLILTAPLILLALLNARTSFVIMLLGACLTVAVGGWTLLRGKSVDADKMKTLIGVTAISTLSLSAIFFVVNLVNPTVISSTITAFERLFYSLVGLGDNPLFSADFWQLPESLAALMIGTGHTAFSIEGIKHSDVGYINDLWAFGVIGTVILYSSIALLFLPVLRRGSNYEKFLAVFLILALVIFQIKGRAFLANPGMLITILMGVVMNLRINRDKVLGGGKDE